jgi:hypothetical protein
MQDRPLDTIPETEVRDYFRNLSKEVTQKFNKIKKGTSHTGAKGEEGDEELKDLLTAFIGNMYMIYTRRQIIDSENRRTHQHDVIITHRNIISQGLMDTQTSYLFAESVACVFEVKALLDRAKLKDAIGKLRELNQLKKTHIQGDTMYAANAIAPKIFRGIFVYAAASNLNQVHEWILQINKELGIVKDEEIDWLYIHEVGAIFRTEGRVIKMQDGTTKTTPRPYYAVATAEDTLLVMLMQLLTIDVMILGRYDPNAYFSRMTHPAFP